MPRSKDWIEEGGEKVGRAVRSIARGVGGKDWWVREGNETRQLSEEKLRRRLRKGDYSGLELARPDGETEWKPLHSYPLFTEEVPHSGNAERAAAFRSLRGLVGISIGHRWSSPGSSTPGPTPLQNVMTATDSVLVTVSYTWTAMEAMRWSIASISRSISVISAARRVRRPFLASIKDLKSADMAFPICLREFSYSMVAG